MDFESITLTTRSHCHVGFGAKLHLNYQYHPQKQKHIPTHIYPMTLYTLTPTIHLGGLGFRLHLANDVCYPWNVPPFRSFHCPFHCAIRHSMLFSDQTVFSPLQGVFYDLKVKCLEDYRYTRADLTELMPKNLDFSGFGWPFSWRTTCIAFTFWRSQIGNDTLI